MKPTLAATAITSDWMGILKSGGVTVRLVVHLRQTSDGHLEGTLDNLDVGRVNIPLSDVEFKARSLRFQAWSIDASYEGNVARDGQRIEGTWKMAEDVDPLVLWRIHPSHIDGIWTATLKHQSLQDKARCRRRQPS